MVTHNANLAINTDADQIIIAEAGAHPPGDLPPISYASGGLENADIRKAACDILEGGTGAFQERARRCEGQRLARQGIRMGRTSGWLGWQEGGRVNSLSHPLHHQPMPKQGSHRVCVSQCSRKYRPCSLVRSLRVSTLAQVYIW